MGWTFVGAGSRPRFGSQLDAGGEVALAHHADLGLRVGLEVGDDLGGALG